MGENMKIKDLLSAANRLENTERNIVLNNNNNDILTMRYSLIFNKINVRITLLETDYFFELKLNDKNELILDLTEDRELLKKIDSEIYRKIINKIFNEDI
jgi:hypothetical protein